jgi:hypothetical protein
MTSWPDRDTPVVGNMRWKRPVTVYVVPQVQHIFFGLCFYTNTDISTQKRGRTNDTSSLKVCIYNLASRVGRAR